MKSTASPLQQDHVFPKLMISNATGDIFIMLCYMSEESVRGVCVHPGQENELGDWDNNLDISGFSDFDGEVTLQN